MAKFEVTIINRQYHTIIKETFEKEWFALMFARKARLKAIADGTWLDYVDIIITDL